MTTTATTMNGFPNGFRVQLIPGSRYDHETCACAALEEDVVPGAGYYTITFEDDRRYQYEWKDLVVCTEASAYIEVTSGSCLGITSAHDCENAACKLGFADFTTISDNQNGAPPYCYMDSGFLKFNDNTNTGTCSDDHKCACKAQ